VAVSFICEWKRRKPPTCRKSLTNLFIKCCITALVVIGADWISSCKSNHHMTSTTTVSKIIGVQHYIQYYFSYMLYLRIYILLACGQHINFTKRVSLVGQDLLTLPEHLSSPPVLSGVYVSRSLVLYVCFVHRCLLFCSC